MENNSLFFILFFYIFFLWTVDFKSIKKYYNKPLSYFTLFGFCYVLLSFTGSFSLIFDIPIDRSYIFRQAYFIPFILIAIPVFARSFEMGIFNYLIKRRLILVIATWLLIPGGAGVLLYVTIIILSINNHLIGFFIFLSIFIIEGGFSTSLQILIMQVFVFIYFITRMRINIKYLSFFIVSIIITIYFIPENLLNLGIVFGSNVYWRLIFWVDNIQSTINNTFLVGHGFGTPYFATEGSQISLRTPIRIADNTLQQYGGNTYIAQFVLPQHNSFINAFYRLGIVGLLFFLAYFTTLAKRIKNLNIPYQFQYILLLNMIIIGANVGLESPHNCTQFVIINALIHYTILENYNKYQISNYQLKKRKFLI